MERTKVASRLGGKQGGGMTAAEGNQTKTDNRWSAEKVCGHRAEVQERSQPLPFLFICSIEAFLFFSASLYSVFHHLRQLPLLLCQSSSFFGLFRPSIFPFSQLCLALSGFISLFLNVLHLCSNIYLFSFSRTLCVCSLIACHDRQQVETAS